MVWNRWLQIGLLGSITVAVNYFTLPLWLRFPWLHSHFNVGDYYRSLFVACVWLLNVWTVGMLAWMIVKRMTMGDLWQKSGGFLLFSWLLGVMIMLTVNPMYAGKWQYLRLLLPFGLLIVLAKAFVLLIIRKPSVKWLKGIATVVFAVFALLLVLEGAFMFVARSNANNTSLASRVWFGRYWELNSLGYREAEENLPVDPKKQHLLLVGDSFLAGHGIRDTADRFSNLLQSRIGTAWQVHNHGQNGASAAEVVTQITTCPFDPDLIIYCWFVNDIQGAADQLGVSSPGAGLKPPHSISLIHGSYFFNYFYHLFPAEVNGEDYLAYLTNVFLDQRVREVYRAQLRQIQEAAQKKHSKFAVVLFPMVNQCSTSALPIKDEILFWMRRDVPWLEIKNGCFGTWQKDFVVNSSDSHPNELAHRYLGDEIWRWLQVEQLLEDTPKPR